MSVYTKQDLQKMQSWTLERKIQVTQAKILEWYYHYNGNVYVSEKYGYPVISKEVARCIYYVRCGSNWAVRYLQALDKYGNITEEKGKLRTTGAARTGCCMFCLFGIQREKQPNRFQRMEQTHPKQYDFCINKLGCGTVFDYIGVPYKGAVMNE